MIADDISKTAGVLIEQVDSLDQNEKCDTILRMSIYLMEWGGTMLAQDCSEDLTTRYRSLTREMEKLHSEIRGINDPHSGKDRLADIITFPKR